MAEIKREQSETVVPDPEAREIVTSTDPVTGQTVRVNRTTGEVISEPGLAAASRYDISERQSAGGSGPAIEERREHYVSEDPYAARRMRVYKAERTIYLIFAVLETLIGIRFVLRLLGANPGAGFADFIYGITAPFVAPFVGLFGTPQYNGSVLELHSIVAIIVYALVAWLLVRLVWLIAGETRSAVRTSTEDVERHIP